MRIIVAALVLSALAGSAAASAQTVGGDSSWTAWLGCWELIQDDTRPASAVAPGARTAGARPPASSQRDMRVCVAPEGSPAGVKMTTWAGGQVVLEQAIVADGRDQPLNETGCTGAQRAEWSDNQRQLFMRAELQCTGQPRRSVTGITLLADGPAWLDIQALQVDGDQLLRVRRYRRATDQSSVSPDVAARAEADAQRLASMPIGIEDVIHASSKVASKAVEAMLVETHTTLNLDSRTLIRLQKTGVAGSVTDLMVAMSFPDRFAVERQAAGGFSSSSFSAFSPFSATYGSYDPYFPYVPYSSLSWYSPYYYSFYGYSYSPYAFSPFAYSYWADPYRGLSDRFAPSGGGASAGGGDAAGAGRAIAGRGYTRIRPRDDGGGSAQSGPVTSSSSGGSSTSSGRSGTRSSGGGIVSSDGYSRGGSDSSSGGGSSGGGSSSSGGGSSGGSSSGDSGRTAQPR
jgi:hypothetical protein